MSKTTKCPECGTVGAIGDPPPFDCEPCESCGYNPVRRLTKDGYRFARELYKAKRKQEPPAMVVVRNPNFPPNHKKFVTHVPFDWEHARVYAVEDAAGSEDIDRELQPVEAIIAAYSEHDKRKQAAYDDVHRRTEAGECDVQLELEMWIPAVERAHEDTSEPDRIRKVLDFFALDVRELIAEGDMKGRSLGRRIQRALLGGEIEAAVKMRVEEAPKLAGYIGDDTEKLAKAAKLLDAPAPAEKSKPAAKPLQLEGGADE